jgi:hypothetical protein
MRTTGLASRLLALVLLFTTVSASWRWSLFERNALDRRQNNNDNNNEESATNTPSRTASATNNDDNESASASATGDDENASETGRASGSASITGGRGNSTRTSSASSKSTLVDPRLPAGGVSIISPAPTAGASQYYKVGNTITFEWNYTSLSNTPSAIDVFATCSLNQATYTIASNMSVEETGKVEWDTGDQEQYTDGFPVATYTLYIHDASRDPTQVAAAGDLAAYNQLRFGIYTGQPYTPLNDFKCSTCNAALSLHEQQALGVLGVTIAVTVLSFTVFANNAGLFA